VVCRELAGLDVLQLFLWRKGGRDPTAGLGDTREGLYEASAEVSACGSFI